MTGQTAGAPPSPAQKNRRALIIDDEPEIAEVLAEALERVGFEHFFIGTSLIGIPVALLAWFVWRNHPPAATAAEPATVE